jgi:HPt (histidine-containing phosphotransfer) domain-containing protein
MARHATVPVVAMTANVSADDRRLCLEAGMHDVIGKPIVPARLLTTIQRWIMQPAQADVSFSTTGMTDVAEVTVNIEPTMLTFDSLRELVDGDDEALNELLITFQASLVETRASLRAARDAGDSEALAFLAHRFKSAAGQLEAHGCATLCGAVQVAARQDPTMALPETGALISRLLESLDALDESIRVSLGRSLTT